MIITFIHTTSNNNYLYEHQQLLFFIDFSILTCSHPAPPFFLQFLLAKAHTLNRKSEMLYKYDSNRKGTHK